MRAKLAVLAGQTLSLGLFCAFLVVPASALFLERYGARALPYAYLAVAATGVVVSAAMRRAQARLALGALAVSVVGTFLVLVAAAWVILTVSDGIWVTFPLLVLFPVSIPIGFVLVGSQAGRLLDVREMKAYLPRVFAGFSVGFGCGGLLAAWLVHVVGGPVQLLGFDTASAACWLLLAVISARRHPAELGSRPDRVVVSAIEPTGVPSLLHNRLVLAVFGYQLLSAAVTQLLDYMVWERAAVHYPHASALARFQGIFGAILNLVALAFVALLAGRLLSRFGVRSGLSANPAGVLVVLVAATVLGFAGGLGSTAFFLVICATQVTDITLTDGLTRTSINASYQALPRERRLAAQTGVEGAGVPLALGFVGVLLLALRALSLDVRAVAVVTLGLTLVWFALSRWAAHEYATGLRDVFAHRAWDPRAIQVGDAPAQRAVDRLLASPDPRDVRVAISALVNNAGPAAAQLTSLLNDPVTDVRLGAAAALAGKDSTTGRAALDAWRAAVYSDDAALVGAALNAAAAAPSTVFVPDLIAVAGRPTPPSALADALDAHAELLAQLLTAPDGPAMSPLARERILRSVGAARVPSLRSLLVFELGHPNPSVREAAAHSLGATSAEADLNRTTLRALLELEADRTARALAVLTILPDAGLVLPLRQGLHDEITAAAEQAAGVLALAGDGLGIRRAISALSTRTDRALALELIEVTAGQACAPLALTLVDPSLDDHQRRTQLSAFAPTATDAGQWLHDIVIDSGNRWGRPWLRACALYAAPDVLDHVECPEFAAPWVGDPDPIVAQTAQWAADHG